MQTWHHQLGIWISSLLGALKRAVPLGSARILGLNRVLHHSQQEGADEVIAWDDRPVFETCQSVSAEHLCSAGEC